MAPAGVDVSIVIKAAPGLILKAFFEADAIGAWWGATRSVTIPRTLGPFVVEWTPTDFTDDVLGRLGGVFRGTVMQYEPLRGFFVADAFWLPPDGDPIGPMALDVRVQMDLDERTTVHVTQSGFEEGTRWRRYYEVIGVGWERALAAMKNLLEK